MKITPLAADSLGTRSTATLVEAGSIRILIDPGVSLGPTRYGLSPHPKELEAYAEQSKRVMAEAGKADVLIITHYHYDHYSPFENLDVYKNKIVFVKHPTENINFSQKNRAKEFLLSMQYLPERLEYADNNEFKVKGVTIRFSKAFFHGNPENKLGYVLMVSIKDESNCFVFASDIQGPVVAEATDWIIQENPDTVYLDGLSTIFLGWKEDPALLNTANNEEIKLLEHKSIKTIILDHHLVRDLYYKDKIKPVIECAVKNDKRVVTAAEYLRLDNSFLEANRKELYKQGPGVKSDFISRNFE